MVDTLLERLDMAVQHRRVGMNAHLVYSPRDFKPPLARNLVSGDQRPGALGEDLRTAARTASHSSVAELFDHPFERLSRDFYEEIQLHHCEGFQMDGWKAILQATQHVEVILKRQFRIEASDNVELRQCVRILLLGELEHLLELHRVAAFLTGLSRVGALAELAVNHTDVRVVDVAVDVIEREVAVKALPHVIGEAA
jgi:hypothetical protein